MDDGWKRLVVSAACDGTPSVGARHYINLVTTGDKILVWGSQYEEGHSANSSEYGYVTSYIPTNGTTVTRSRDIVETKEDLGINNR